MKDYAAILCETDIRGEDRIYFQSCIQLYKMSLSMMKAPYVILQQHYHSVIKQMFP